MDHDDTVVNSTATGHYPCFLEYMKIFKPQVWMSLDEYFLKNFDPGMVSLLRDEVGMTDEQMDDEFRFWQKYVESHFPQSYEGIREILWDHKNQGGYICVVSHSVGENILKDYERNGLPKPDLVFGWEYPVDKRKPSPWPLQEIMRQLDLQPKDLLMVDDLKPGCDMAKSVGVDFAGAGWSNNIVQIESFLRENSTYYFKTVSEFGEFLKEKRKG